MRIITVLLLCALTGCATTDPLPGFTDAAVPKCYQGVDFQGRCRDGTGEVVYLGIETMVSVSRSTP